VPPEVLSVAQARAANVGVGLSDAALEETILEEEAWLARRIGPLTGTRTEVFWLSGATPSMSLVHLKRPTGSATATLDGDDLTADVQVRGEGWILARQPEGTRWHGRLEATYTPNDEAEVRRALKELVAVTTTSQASPGMASEQVGSYAYQRAKGALTGLRQSIVASLLEPGRAGSSRLLGAPNATGSIGVLET
jgi:hypothetical protein